MSSIFTIKNPSSVSATPVPDLFIEEYMPQANGEFVKIYLYLLHMTHMPAFDISLSSIADVFSCTEKDVLRALNYWKNAGLMTLEFDSSHELSSLSFLPIKPLYQERPSAATAAKAAAGPALSSVPSAAAAGPQAGPAAGLAAGSAAQTALPASRPAPQEKKYLSPGQIQELQKGNSDIKQLLFLAEQYLRKTLSATDMQRLLYFYDELHFPVDLIEYLIEYCVSQNHRSLSYIEKVGLAWHEEQVHTVSAAKQRTNTWSKDYFVILKAFGIRGRDPVATEVEYMNRWLKEYGFSMEVIQEACSRTIAQTAQPSFKYAEGILSKWKKENVRALGDVHALDEQHQKRVRSSDKAAEARPHTANRFNNFHQREYDYEKLERQLLNQ